MPNTPTPKKRQLCDARGRTKRVRKVGTKSMTGPYTMTTKYNDKDKLYENYLQGNCYDGFCDESEKELYDKEYNDEDIESKVECKFDSDSNFCYMNHSCKKNFRHIFDEDNYSDLKNRPTAKSCKESFHDFFDKHVDDLNNHRENGYRDKRRYDDFYNRLDTDYYSVLDDYFNRENDEDDEYYDPDYDFWFMKYIKHTTDEDSFQDWSSPSDVDMSGEQEEQYYVDIDYSSGEET
ncbi:hypothetical protein DPMN_141978 [Dreissena polymorpha]|uniref:Uncharacterized protein n=1 Tax=Dreissena polymorpha TaxID=45954 RepID=A0A9D4JN25_DREPO|nr:hypothetical protein DPMN_141978 [Dreissena polymorpha]